MISKNGKTIFSIASLVLAVLTIVYILFKIIYGDSLQLVVSTIDLLDRFNYFFYFTNLSNILASIWLFMWSFNNLSKTNKFKIVNNQYIQAGITCYMLTTMLVYWIFGVTLLNYSVMDHPIYIIINLHLHLIAPLFFFVLWLLPTNTQKMSFKKSLYVLFAPFIYGVIVEIRGLIDGWYPYGFFDIRRLWAYFFSQDYSLWGSIFLLMAVIMLLAFLIYLIMVVLIMIRNYQIEYKRKKGEII